MNTTILSQFAPKLVMAMALGLLGCNSKLGTTELASSKASPTGAVVSPENTLPAYYGPATGSKVSDQIKCFDSNDQYVSTHYVYLYTGHQVRIVYNFSQVDTYATYSMQYDPNHNGYCWGNETGTIQFNRTAKTVTFANRTQSHSGGNCPANNLVADQLPNLLNIWNYAQPFTNGSVSNLTRKYRETTEGYIQVEVPEIKLTADAGSTCYMEYR